MGAHVTGARRETRPPPGHMRPGGGRGASAGRELPQGEGEAGEGDQGGEAGQRPSVAFEGVEPGLVVAELLVDLVGALEGLLHG